MKILIAHLNTDLALVPRVLNLAGHLHCLLVQAGLVQRLGVVQPVLLHLRVHGRQLLVGVSGLHKVLGLVVAICQQRQCCARLRDDSLKILISGHLNKL